MNDSRAQDETGPSYHQKRWTPLRAWIFISLLILFASFLGGCGTSRRSQGDNRQASLPAEPGASTQLVLTIIDVGQGDAILLQCPSKETMLVDAGDVDHGSRVVDYLGQRGIHKIDLLVATHPHADHIGGMPAVLEYMTVGQVWDSNYNSGSPLQRRWLKMIKERGIRYGQPAAGTVHDFSGVKVEVIAPVRMLSDTDSDANNNSLVLRISYRQFSALLTGDMETEERQTVRNWQPCTVIKMAHHGSRNGMALPWLLALHSNIGLISCGINNEYGHPHAETLAALAAAHIQTCTTATAGNLVVISDGGSVSLAANDRTRIDLRAIDETNPGRGTEPEYIGNTRSKVFHSPSCNSLPAENHRQRFASREIALHQGYHPCSRCRP